ncbi:hypothetical protein KP509_08G072400 [Ceratopteris richardii]|uniref:HVA22-like protein n=1 Tax=Ceratopteris richardii TaxID=49495 RepID=A0A8T2UEG9_CERRI|nr:hypothetical protein KP509_08G072400 [Ceratopteris richardii]
MSWIRAILANFDIIGGPIMMLLYPLFASIKAIESPSKIDDQQWLTYWILYSFITLVELSFWKLFYWIPLWGKIKFFLICWLVLPQFNGAAFIYDYFVRKKLLKDSKGDAPVSPRLERMMSVNAQASVQQFINNYGQDAFEKVIAAATNEARKYKLSPSSKGA